jgi:hypothetical protein
MNAYIASDYRLSFRFVAGSASSFSICTGLAGTTTLPIFTLPCFWSCYRPPGCFHPEVRPFALKGIWLSTFLYFVEIQLVVRRRTAEAFPELLLDGAPLPKADARLAFVPS